MAISFGVSGDRWARDAEIPKKFLLANYTAGGTTVPAVGHLCKQDTALNDGIVQCVDDDKPLYQIISINSSSGILTVIKLVKTVSVVMEHESATTPSLGQGVVAAGSPGTIPIGGILRDQVQGITLASGVGLIVSIDAGALPQLIRVEFGS